MGLSGSKKKASVAVEPATGGEGVTLSGDQSSSAGGSVLAEAGSEPRSKPTSTKEEPCAAELSHGASDLEVIPAALGAPTGSAQAEGSPTVVVGSPYVSGDQFGAEAPVAASAAVAVTTSAGASQGLSPPALADTPDSSHLLGATVPEQARETSALVAAVEAEDWATADGLLRAAGALDPCARTADFGYSLLRAAAEEGQLETCRLLVERSADVNARDTNGMTPLMGCVTGGDYGDLVALLLDAHADPSATTDDGFTALMWATRLGHEESVRRLRAAGATGKSSAFS